MFKLPQQLREDINPKKRNKEAPDREILLNLIYSLAQADGALVNVEPTEVT